MEQLPTLDTLLVPLPFMHGNDKSFILFASHANINQTRHALLLSLATYIGVYLWK